MSQVMSATQVRMHFGEVMRRVSSEGEPVLLLAAQARLARAIVVTHDSDFGHLDVVREDWIASAS